MAGGFVMFGVASTTHQAAPLLVAFVLFAYGILVPLRVGAAIFSRAFVATVAKAMLAVFALGSTAYGLSLAVNSGLALVSMLGNAMFLALVAGVVIVLVRTIILKAVRSIPSVTSVSGNAVSTVRSQLQLVSIYFRLQR